MRQAKSNYAVRYGTDQSGHGDDYVARTRLMSLRGGCSGQATASPDVSTPSLMLSTLTSEGFAERQPMSKHDGGAIRKHSHVIAKCVRPATGYVTRVGKDWADVEWHAGIGCVYRSRVGLDTIRLISDMQLVIDPRAMLQARRGKEVG